jgi:hypothetical protein
LGVKGRIHREAARMKAITVEPKKVVLQLTEA